MKKNNEAYSSKEIDSPVVVTPYKENKRSHKPNWQAIKNSTRGVSQKLASKKKPVTITSAGPFNGFDLKVKKTFSEDYKYLNFSVLKVVIEFTGTLSGGQRVTAQVINDIKQSAGFADKLKEILIKELDGRKGKVEEILEDYDPQKLDDFTKKYNGAVVETRYKYGKIAFDMYLTTSDYDLIKENIKKQVDCFIKSETKNLRFLNKKY